MEYETVIGLEVHVQLNCKTKIFTRAPYKYGQEPNTLTNPVVLALPGTLPVMNLEAIRSTIKAGLMFDCKIADFCKWDRKNYFYPDLPKGYQISQFDKPLCIGGYVEIELPGSSRNVMGEHKQIKLTRIHLEEDVGKLSHGEGHSLVDYNRAGTGLMEIVSEPDMRNTEEVVAYLNSIRMHMLYAGVSDCDMEKGQLRCDANISVRPKGQKELNTRVEIKNLNSISGVRNGVEYEIRRQIKATEAGNPIVQETRRWDPAKGVTVPMRTKEMAHDYRYFPDPDLMPVKVSADLLNQITSELPERPFRKQERFLEQYQLPYTITSVFYPNKGLSAYFEQALETCNQPKMVANLIINDLLRELSAGEQDGALHISESKVTPQMLGELVGLVHAGDISKQIAQDVFMQMFQTGHSATQIVEEQGLKQSQDTGELESICSEVIANNPKPVEQFKAGKDTAINALKGQVMKASKGKANPQTVDEMLRKLLS